MARVPGRARGAPAAAAFVRARGLPRGLAALDAASRRSARACCAALDRARRRLEALLGVGGQPPIADAELEALIGEEERASAAWPAACRLERASTREVQWLLRRAACRGLGEPVLDPHWQPAALVVETADGRPAYEPLECDLVRHVNAPILEQDRDLVVDAPEGRSYQAMLALGALPEETVFPGSAELLFAPLEARRVPGRLRAARALDRQPRGDRAGAPADRRRRQRLRRAADLRARAAVVTRSRRTGSSRASSTPTCSRTSGRRC